MEMVLLPHKEQFVYMCVFLFTSTCLVYVYTFMKSGFIHFWFVVRYIRGSVHAVFDSNLDYDTHCTYTSAGFMVSHSLLFSVYNMISSIFLTKTILKTRKEEIALYLWL